MLARIKEALSVVLRGTVFSILKSLQYECANLKSAVNMANVRSYWSQYNNCERSSQKTILIDLLFEHVGTNNNSLLVSSLIASKENVHRIGLIDIPIRWRLRNFASKYGVSAFISTYSYKNPIYYMRSLIYILPKWNQFTYTKAFGISVIIDKQEVGDLIYDQFMREKFQPSVRKVTFLYKLYIFKYIATYFRYVDIIKNSNITDIVLSHNVYAQFGLLARAAAHIDENINIWQWFGLSPLNISNHKATKSFIRMPRYYLKEHGQLIEERLGKLNVERMYEELADKRYSASDSNQIDLVNVYQNVEIECEEQFCEFYRPKECISFIFSHAFVDAVKYTDWQLYSDYYTWLENTLICLADKSKEGSIFVKSHPSEHLYPCKERVKDLVDRINLEFCAEFIFLDKKVSNSIIFSLASSIITCSGSIAMEAPCFGVPCVISASSLFENSGALFQAKNIREYETLLDDIYSFPRLNNESIYSAKLTFLWFSKFVYSHADFLVITDGSIKANYEVECQKVNNAYLNSRELYKQELYITFHDVYLGKTFDSISLIKGND